MRAGFFIPLFALTFPAHPQEGHLGYGHDKWHQGRSSRAASWLLRKHYQRPHSCKRTKPRFGPEASHVHALTHSHQLRDLSLVGLNIDDWNSTHIFRAAVAACPFPWGWVRHCDQPGLAAVLSGTYLKIADCCRSDINVE